MSSGGLLCISIRIENPFDRHSKHDNINNCSYYSTLKCLHVNYFVFINRYAENLYDFVRLVLNFESLWIADSIRTKYTIAARIFLYGVIQFEVEKMKLNKFHKILRSSWISSIIIRFESCHCCPPNVKCPLTAFNYFLFNTK